MTTARAEVIDAIRDATKGAERMIAKMPADAWDRKVYDDGWTAKQILAHLVVVSRLWAMLVLMARQHQESGALDPVALLNDEARAGRMRSVAAGETLPNPIEAVANEMAALEAVPPAEALDDIRAAAQRSVAEVEAAGDDLLVYAFSTPWGSTGPLADLIAIDSIRDHFVDHVRDLATSVQAG